VVNRQCAHRARISADMSASDYECFLSHGRKTPMPPNRNA
jgi:hypothetical protein